METVTDFIFLGSKITVNNDSNHENKIHLLFGGKAMTNIECLSSIKKQRYYFANKDPYSQSYGFSSSHVWMWELDHKEGWELKNWCFKIMVLEKTLESPLGRKETQPVTPKGNTPRIFIGRTNAKAEAPVFWLSDAKSQLIGKDTNAGKDWRHREKRTAENEIVR